MFNNCYNLSDETLNPVLRSMSGKNPAMLGMFNGCNTLDVVDLST
jgi:hypothetical protein